MKTYEVVNPFLVFSIQDGENSRKEYTQKKGDRIELPENNITVRALLARRQIKEVPQTAAQDSSEVVASATNKSGSRKSNK